MPMKKILTKTHVALVIALGLIGLAVYAEASIDEITFPVVELGECADREECFAYCEDETHIQECVDFAERHGLIAPEDAAIARKYPEVVAQGGPGGCDSMSDCEAYCTDIAHIGECVTFAEKYGLVGSEELAEAKQIAQALSQGAKMPGGCTHKMGCKTYCEDMSHAEECLAFAEAAGMMSQEEIAEAKQMIPFIQKGEMPGQCTTKRECEDYCGSEEHFDECVGFAEKSGLISAEDAEMARKIGGKGPGGCDSKFECEIYCDTEENQRECFNFAKEHSLLSAEELAQVEEGVGRLRAGLDQAPDEVRTCLKETLGEETMKRIEEGSVLPSPEMGEKMKECFAGYVDEMQKKLEDALAEASEETKDCVKEKAGAENLAKIRAGEPPSPEAGGAIRSCFEKEHKEGMRRLVEGLETMPDEARVCVEGKLGVTLQEVKQGKTDGIGPEAEDHIQKCMSDLAETVMKEIEAQAPEEVTTCLRKKYEAGLKERIMAGEIRGPEDIKPEISECASLIAPPEGSRGGSAGATAAPPSDFQPDAQMCKQFERAPSCDYVPDNVKDLCLKCRN
jgi:hypothetical protein